VKNILDPMDLDLSHVRVIVQGMVHVAHSDGAHPRELVLIREFYEACRGEAKGLAYFADLEKTAFDVEGAREVLDNEALKLTFLASCYLVAYADGHVSEPEKRAIEKLVKDLGIEEVVATRARELVKDQLLMQLARNSNLVAITKIAKDL
jgi:uncharacterized membrane protein YebE (DUF533 family)